MQKKNQTVFVVFFLNGAVYDIWQQEVVWKHNPQLLRRVSANVCLQVKHKQILVNFSVGKKKLLLAEKNLLGLEIIF